MTAQMGFWHSSTKAGGALLLVGGFAALGLVGCPSGGVGDPCVPEDEFKEAFAGFKLTEENIESRSFQCQTRICLVNHFQGRVSCPQGQPAPKVCSNGESCNDDPGTECRDAGVILKDCDPTSCGAQGADQNNCNDEKGVNKACGGTPCNKKSKVCECTGSAGCPDNYFCDDATKLCTTRVCSKDRSEAEKNNEQRCYVPGTNTPVSVPVCSQCSSQSKRDADTTSGKQPAAVYCSCRCGPPSTGATAADENFNFCECGEGFQCLEIRPNVGLGDAQVAGKYCVRQDTQYKDETTCGQVKGYWGGQCFGTAPPGGGS